jgi:hypothetical protein
MTAKEVGDFPFSVESCIINEKFVTPFYEMSGKGGAEVMRP